LNRPWQDVRFTTRDGVALSGWFFPAPAHGAFTNVTVVINHGNAGNISHRLSLYELLLDLGVNVLAYDYRGYGQSEGRPSEAGTFMDGEAAIDWLKQRGADENNIIVHGESLGGAIAVELALRRPKLRGVIVRSSFTSVQDLGAELFPFLPVRTVGTIHYEIRNKLKHVRVPVLILHSREDTLIGFHHAEANFAAANEPKWLREIRGNHNDQPDASPGLYSDAVREFLLATESRPEALRSH
jgi:fermentation-respiration switch protein FrsA (DUF1100 family)